MVKSLALMLSLTGCATCNQHPLACDIAGAIIIGSVAVAAAHGNFDRHHAAPPDYRIKCNTEECVR
jgi:hypothetical protein